MPFMKLTDYEKKALKEIDKWHGGGSSLVQQMMDWAMMPVDWAVNQFVPENLLIEADGLITKGLEVLNDASQWTYTEHSILERAQKSEISLEKIEDLQEQPLEKLDELARSYFDENALLAAIQGGGMSLGGPVLLLADVPLLFTINFRLIQQIGACYGFSMRGDQFTPLVLSIYNVASSGGQTAKKDALREISVAAAAFANEMNYKGRKGANFQDQNRHLPREIAKNLIGAKLGQMIPLAGIAIGAGVNYWFTSQTALTTFMLFRQLYIERKERM
ncbi:MAG: EcsC family protein [Bacteroidetes Order II. Incertae sedis bacterium]|nr:EcsC family protein [Bacteroidetes Order II. bacterium]